MTTVTFSTGQLIADRVQKLLDSTTFEVQKINDTEWRVYTTGRFKFYCGGFAFERSTWIRLAPTQSTERGGLSSLTCSKHQDQVVRAAIYKAIDEVVHGR